MPLSHQCDSQHPPSCVTHGVPFSPPSGLELAEGCWDIPLSASGPWASPPWNSPEQKQSRTSPEIGDEEQNVRVCLVVGGVPSLLSLAWNPFPYGLTGSWSQDTTISKWRLLRSTFYSGETEAPGGLTCSLRPPMEIMQAWIRTQCCCLSSSPSFP